MARPTQNIQAYGLEMTEYTLRVPRLDWVSTRKRRVNAKAQSAGQEQQEHQVEGSMRPGAARHRGAGAHALEDLPGQ